MRADDAIRLIISSLCHEFSSVMRWPGYFFSGRVAWSVQYPRPDSRRPVWLNAG